MKKCLPLFLVCLITFLLLTPKVGIFAYTQDDYYNVVASYFLSSMLVSGDANELDFSTGDGDIDFLTALGEAIVTGDYSGLVEYGLEDITDDIIFSIHQIDDAVYELNPEFYEFLVGEGNGAPTRISINPAYGHITRHLLTDLENNNLPSAGSPPEYESVIERFNSNIAYGFFWRDGLNTNYNSDVGNMTVLTFPYQNYSYFGFQSNQVKVFNSGNNGYGYNNIGASNPLTLYINSVDSTHYLGTINNITNISFSSLTANPLQHNTYAVSINRSADDINSLNINGYGSSSNSSTINTSFRTTSLSYTGESLINVLEYFCARFKNINIYVDGDAWSIVHLDNSIPISIPGNMTILNNQPAQYYYSQPVYFDMHDLINKIKTAINQSNILTYNDIEDLIVDINGQEALAVVNFARNDYDVLASEQLPYYPKFYYDANLNQYAQAGAQIVNISTEVLPRDVLNIIITCGVILLFGYVVRRLLE